MFRESCTLKIDGRIVIDRLDCIRLKLLAYVLARLAYVEITTGSGNGAITDVKEFMNTWRR